MQVVGYWFITIVLDLFIHRHITIHLDLKPTPQLFLIHLTNIVYSYSLISHFSRRLQPLQIQLQRHLLPNPFLQNVTAHLSSSFFAILPLRDS